MCCSGQMTATLKGQQVRADRWALHQRLGEHPAQAHALFFACEGHSVLVSDAGEQSGTTIARQCNDERKLISCSSKT